VKGCWC